MSDLTYRLYRDKKWPKELLYKEKYERIRKHLKEVFEGLVFIEKTHQYFYKGKELTPTSNVCHLFKQVFNADEQAERCSETYWDVEDSKYYHMTKEEILKAWEDNSLRATTHGTKVHLFGQNVGNWLLYREDLIEGDEFEIKKDEDGREYVETSEPKEVAILKFFDQLPMSVIPIQFEIPMFTLKYGISGTADLLFLYDKDIESDENYEDIKKSLWLMDYKGLPLDTPILTENGWKTIGSLNENDVVYDKDCHPSKILHISDIHYNPCFKITFDNRSNIVADHEHRWYVHCGNKNKVVTTTELADLIKKQDVYIQELGSIDKPKPNFLRVVSVKKTNTVLTKCIEVESPSHTYLCGKNLLVTHNTNKNLYNNFGGQRMLEPFEDLLDEDLSGYILQGAIYSSMIKEHGYDFIARYLIWLRDSGEFEKVPMQDASKRLFAYLDEHPVKQLMEERGH